MKSLQSYLHKYEGMPVQIRASFWFLVCAFMQKGISIVTTPIFTRLLSTEQYGQINVFNSWTEIVGIFVTLRIYFAVYVQGLVKFEDDRAHYASSMQGLGLTLCVGWMFVYLFSRTFWNTLFHLTTVQMLSMFAMIWATEAFGFWAAEQRNQYRYKMLVAVTFGVSVTMPTVAIAVVALTDDKATARIVSFALVELVGYSGLFFAQMRRGRQFFSAKYWKYALKFNIPLVPHYLSDTVLSGADRIMIERMVGTGEAGIYGLAYALSLLMSLFNQALSQTMNPWIYQKIKAKQTDDIAIVTVPALLFVAGVNLVLIALAPEVVAVFAPKQYYDAIWVIPPVAMSVFFMFCYGLFVCFEFYYENTTFIMTTSIISALVNVALNYVCIRKFGYYAAGYTTLACYMIYALGHYLCMKRICVLYGHNQVYDNKVLLSITASFLAAGFLFLFSYRYPPIRYALLLAVLASALIKRRFIIAKLNLLLSVKRKPNA